MIPRQIALYASLGAAVVIALLLAWSLRLDNLRAGYKRSLETTIANYRKAQADAQADFDLKVAAITVHNEKANQNADAKASDIRTVYRDRVIRLPAASSCGPANSAGLPEANVPESADRSGSDAIVSIKRDDAMICAINQSRLEAAHAWAAEMMGE